MRSVRVFLVAVTMVAGIACELTKTENPLSPTVAGPIPGVEITAPKPLEPAPGALIPGDKQPITLLLENSSSNGQRPLQYLIEVASDPGFNNIVFRSENVSPGPNGRTSVTLPSALGPGRAYLWRARAADGANTGPYFNPVLFNVFTPVSFDKPTLVSPAGGVRVTSYTPEFRIGNAPRAGSPSLVTYAVEVATNAAFTAVVAAWQFSEQPNETRFTAPSGLPPGSQIFWRARAFEGGAIGPWSDTATFATPVPVAPTPAPGGAGGACSNDSQLGIVTCQRNKYGAHMSSAQMVQFLRAIATDLNRLGTWGTGYGLLRKNGGSNCTTGDGNFYSCDIICQGNTESSQKQYDVLLDADGTQQPLWGGPKTAPNIRFDVCTVP